MSKDAEQLVSLVREIVKDEIKNKDAAIICNVVGANADGTLNISLLSDPDTVISNVYNCTPYNFKSGDYAILYKINNNVNNSFIIAKPTAEEPSRVSTTMIQNFVSQNLSNINPLNFYPIGSIYMSVNKANPTEIFGGEWEQIKDRFLLAAGDAYAAGGTGGEEEHTLTIDEMPSHNHKAASSGLPSQPSFVQKVEDGNFNIDMQPTAGNSMIVGATAATGGGNAHNNMPPYLAVYMWKRTK